jgi:hypothetical protein
MEWADIDRVTGLVATSATASTDVVRLAFKPGTAPKEPSTAEAIQKVREARGRASSLPLDERAWGASTSQEAAPPTQESEWTRIEPAAKP